MSPVNPAALFWFDFFKKVLNLSLTDLVGKLGVLLVCYLLSLTVKEVFNGARGFNMAVELFVEIVDFSLSAFL